MAQSSDVVAPVMCCLQTTDSGATAVDERFLNHTDEAEFGCLMEWPLFVSH